MYVTSFNVPSIVNTAHSCLTHRKWSRLGEVKEHTQGSYQSSRILKWPFWGKIKVSLSSSNPDICFHFPKGIVYRYSAWLCNSYCYHSSYWNFLMPRLRFHTGWSEVSVQGLSFFVTQLMLPFHHLAFFSFLHTSTTFYTNTDARLALLEFL